jgi:hypothetical protein
MTRVLRLKTPKIFRPLLEPARYKGAFGGRGSGKSHFFAECAVEYGLLNHGSRIVCIREVQKSLKESVKLLLEDKIKSFELTDQFAIMSDHIKTPGGGIILFQGMQDHSADSIKSLEGFDIAYVEEAQTLTERSLEMLRPTIRKPRSEIWFSWNPRNAIDPVDAFLRGETPAPNSIVVKSNYCDNPFLPAELEEERAHDEKTNPVRYPHIWKGEYEPQAIGAIWTRETIHNCRRDEEPPLTRVLIGVDPPITSNPGSDEAGIIAGGLGEDGRGYIIGDYSKQGSPHEWASAAVAAYDLHDADAIVIEVNQGGDMVKHTIHSIRPNIRVVEVRASKGKHVRAEPISALYEVGRVSHIGAFPKLEAQMVLMTAEGYDGADSPDRLDALVWLLTELFPRIVKKTKPRHAMPKQANSSYNPHKHRR